MRCPVCGQEYDQPSKFCPNCGVPQPESAPPVQQPTDYYAQPAQPPVQPVQPAQDVFSQPSQQAYVRQDYSPVQPQPPVYGQQYGQQAPSYGQPAYTPVQPVGQKPSATGQIVFSIINIVCCGWLISTILGIIALVFSIMASSETNYDEAARKLKTAKILNIIGIVLVAIFVIVYAVAIIAAIAAGDWSNFEYNYGFDY